MKKLIAVISLFSILLSGLSLTSCNKNDQDEFNIAETKDIVLGNEVNSVELITVEGEKITYDNTADFYEIYNKVAVPAKTGKKHSCIAETNLQDKGKSFINMNVYYLDGAELYEYRTKKEGDDTVAVIEEYSYRKQLSDNKFEMSEYCKYTYKDEKAFGGMENGSNGNAVYSSEAYPKIPEVGTELNDMQVRAVYLRNLINSTRFFENYEANDKTYDFNDLVTREYKLYENYIVFKQTAPFLRGYIASGHDPSILYAAFSNSDCSITQEAYCNVKTGEIEFIKVYGDTLWHTAERWGQKLEIDLKIYIHNIDGSEGKQKVDDLINYVKSNVE